MQAASRAYVLAAAAVAATSAVVLTPAAPKAAHIPVRNMETRLVDYTDVPINLFDDIANIPYNEIAGHRRIRQLTALQRGLVGAQRHEHLGYRPR